MLGLIFNRCKSFLNFFCIIVANFVQIIDFLPRIILYLLPSKGSKSDLLSSVMVFIRGDGPCGGVKNTR